MNTNLLTHGEGIFAEIKRYISESKYEMARNIIENTAPPSEWVIELPSKSNRNETYKTIPLEIMEGAMKTIFGCAGIKSISSPTITQDKSGRYAVTVVAEYYYKDFAFQYPDANRFTNVLPGVATVVSPDINMLELVTPKASSMAIKNAIKQMGDLFGKSLNKIIEEEEIPQDESSKPMTKEEMNYFLSQQIITCTSIEDLKSYRLVVYSKGTSAEIQELYESRLRSFKTK
jgi:hypothetical protein